MAPQTRLGHPQATLPRVMTGADQVVQRLRTLSASVGPSAVSSQFYTRTRTKTADSIQGKIQFQRQRSDSPKRPATPDYSFRDITDYAGFRIVTLYDEQLLDAINHIIEIVRAGQNLAEPLFAKGSIWDCFHDGVFNARTPDPFNSANKKEAQTDIYYKCLAYLYECIDTYYGEYRPTTEYPKPAQSIDEVKKACDPRPSGDDRYSSAHLTFWANSYHPNELILPIPVEFQIRTAVEDVWGELNHKLLYKSRSPYIWSVDYERSLVTARVLSQRFKKEIDELPEKIAEFHMTATRAQLIANDFWGDKRQSPDWRERKSNTYVSLCAALIVMVSDGKITPEIGGVLGAYDKKIRTLPTQFSDDAGTAETLTECIRHLHDLLRSENQRADGVADEHRKQRALLINLEMTRLEVMLALSGYDYRNGEAVKIRSDLQETGQTPTSIADAQDLGADQEHEDEGSIEPSNHTVQRKLYERLCAFVSDRGLRIKPITMLYVWKYLVCSSFSAELAEINLASAYEVLNQDPTLPYWSIYRAVVPFLRADLLLRQARLLHEAVGKHDVAPSSMVGLRAELLERLDAAFRLAIDAFKEHTSPEKQKKKSRGDIMFLRESYTPINDANLVMEIVIAFDELLDKAIYRRDAQTTDQINDIFDYVRKDIDRSRRGTSRSEIRTLPPKRQKAVQKNFRELQRLRRKSP